MKFNFEEWAQLARQDRAAFERKRAAAIRQAIENAAHTERERRKLRGLQFKVDMIRRKHKTPMGACVEISEMLMEQVYQLVELDINDIIQSSSTVTKQDTEPCKIIPFDLARK